MAEGDAGAWLGAAEAALGVPAEDGLTEELRAELLGLTSDVAHTVVRFAGPLTTYLVGVAVGRGASPQQAIAIVSGLLPKGDE